MNNLAICCGNLRAGGAERVISILANNFVKQGINVKIFTWYKTEVFYSINDRVEICQIPIQSGHSSFFHMMKWFRDKIRNEKPDAILSFLAPFNILTVFSLCGIKTPVIVAERNDPYFVSPSNNWFWKIIRNIAYYIADGVLVQTKTNKNHFPSYIRDKAAIIYNPVTFSAEKIGLALKQKKKKEIVSVTRLEKQKNIELLINAFAIFKQSHPDYILTIYGEGDERQKLEQKILKMNLNNDVFLPGRKQNVHELILGAEFFVMASNFEGMSNSLIEAMCLGLPCISTKVSGATDLIQHGINGLLVDIGDTNGMYEAMCEIVNDRLRAQIIGKTASELYNDLNVDKISKLWLNYIDSIINQ